MNRYELKLQLPVDFIPHKFSNPSNFQEFHLTHDMINSEFKSFLKSLNLYVDYARYFYYPPNFKLSCHIDCRAVDYGNPEEQNNVKLNFVYGGQGSEMIWYQLKPGRQPKFKKNTVGQTIVQYAPEDLEEIYRTNLGLPSLVDTMTVHNIQNYDDERTSYCLTLSNQLTKKRISWAEAVEIFQDYIVN